MLEISIRLKRGLNVVTGNVGTGKTTISRQLVNRLSDDREIDYFLVLDPGFKTVLDFLGYLLNLFTGDTPLTGEDENSVKERIKGGLFSRGVDRQRTTVLIIDEGQKLPIFCIEALRELLNYETNDQKLLQIVIFAQKEFDDAVAGLDNFKDRINFRYSLGPLGFRETRAMIRYRLERSAAPGKKGVALTFLAHAAVYRFTRGYPRKIVNLCHHILLALIIRNRSRAGWRLVRTCGFKVFPERRPSFIFRPVFAAFLLLAGGGVFFNFEPGRLFTQAKAFQADLRPVETVAEACSTFGMVSCDVPPMPRLFPPRALPATYGSLKVSWDETLCSMSNTVYGSFNRDILKKVLAVNPNIRNPNRILANMTIEFPVVHPDPLVWHPGTVCILLAKTPFFTEAYDLARKSKAGNVRLLPRWQDNDFTFLVVVDHPFRTLASAREFKKNFSTTLAARFIRLEPAGGSETLPL